MRDGGKGDKQRPLSVPMKQFDNNWDAIFNKNKQLQEKLEESIQEYHELYKEIE